jgi:hypothetical protein
MNSSKLYACLSSCVLAIAGLTGCVISTEPPPAPKPIPEIPVPTGTVTVSWTVAGSHSGPACSQFGADELELVVFDSRRRPVMTVTTPCSDFSNEVSTSLPLRDIRIIADSDLTIDIDFPTTSRL